MSTRTHTNQREMACIYQNTPIHLHIQIMQNIEGNPV